MKAQKTLPPNNTQAQVLKNWTKFWQTLQELRKTCKIFPSPIFFIF